MTKHQDRFSFPGELGRRLRELRLRAGLTQQDVARLMGRPGRNSKSWVSRLERGEVAQPKLSSIADFLRAVRGSFSEIADILDRYTRQPTATEQQGNEAVERAVEELPARVAKRVLEHDIKTRVRKRFEPGPPEPVDGRVLRAQRLAAGWLRLQMLEDLLHALLDRVGVTRGTPGRKALADHGRKVWGILNRTRRRRRGLRAQLIAEKRDWLAGQGVAGEPVRQVEEAVTGLHARLERDGELDRLPGIEEAKRLDLLGRRRVARTDEQRSQEEFRAQLITWENARNEFVARVREQCGELVSRVGIGPGPAVRYLNSVLPFFNACHAHEPGSAALGRAVDAVVQRFVGEGCDAKAIRSIRDLVLDWYAASRAGFPPDPRKPDRQ